MTCHGVKNLRRKVLKSSRKKVKLMVWSGYRRQQLMLKSRRMKIAMKHKKSKTGKINIIGSPMNFSASKIKYKKTPPTLGEDTTSFLERFLKISLPEIKKLKEEGII